MTRQDAMVGRVIDGRYQIESSIALGGMSRVYLALDRRLDRDVALKVMHEHLAADEKFVSRFVREARAAARLSHPNVVQVFDQGSDGPVLYLAMEYLPGRTLRDALSGRGVLTPREIISVLEPVLGALAAAHRAGIVHGDVKPENVILADDGRIKIADFGLARAMSAPVTSSGDLFGTVAYLAPELVSRGTSDARTDVYAAGTMLFELLTGKQPFTGSDPLEVAYRHVHEVVPAPTVVSPSLPPVFDSVVLRATSKEPTQRPPDAGALLTELKAAISALPPDQLNLRAGGAGSEVARTTVRLEQQAGTEVFTPVFSSPPPAAAAQPQPTLALANPHRPPRNTGLLPRLTVHEDLPETVGGVPVDRQRPVLFAVGAGVVVVLLMLSGIWWFAGGPGSYTHTPVVAGQQQNEAQQLLSAQGLTSTVTQVYSTTVAAGEVISSDPASGAKVKKNGVVLLTVSKGPELVAVPDLGGLSLDDATAAIEKAQLKLGKTSKQTSATVDAGTVISSSPGSGTKIAPGKTVDLVVSQGQILKGVESGLCVQVPDGVQDNQTRTTLGTCDGGDNQAWAATPSGQLTLFDGAKCLDVENGSTDNGAPVQIYDCNGGVNQQWNINSNGSIIGVGSGKCLDATDHGTYVGTPLQIWDCGDDPNPNQQWSRS